MLRAESIGRSPGPQGELPWFSLYGDGRLLRPGKAVGALDVVEETKVSRERFDEIYEAAHDAGLDHDAAYTNEVRDGGALLLTLHSGGQLHRVSATNPQREDGAAVARLVEFRDKLKPVNWPEPATPYQPSRIFAIGSPVGATADATTQPWPFDPLEDACLLLEGADVARAQELAQPASLQTKWNIGGAANRVRFRPALPDETSCVDLKL